MRIGIEIQNLLVLSDWKEEYLEIISRKSTFGSE